MACLAQSPPHARSQILEIKYGNGNGNNIPPRPPPRSPKRLQFDRTQHPWSLSLPICPQPSTTVQHDPRALQPINETHELVVNTCQETNNLFPTRYIMKDMPRSMTVFKNAYSVQKWLQELEDWPWDGTFEIHHRDQDPSSRTQDSLAGVPWNFFSPEKVKVYLDRVQIVSRQLEKLNLRRLKISELRVDDQQMHLCSVKTDTATLPLIQLDSGCNLTTSTTELLLRTLTQHDKLSTLLKTWKIRLIVLSRLPAFLSCLNSTNQALNAAWHLIGFNVITVPNKTISGVRRVPTASFCDLSALRSGYEPLRMHIAQQVANLCLDRDNMQNLLLHNSKDLLPEKLANAVIACEHDYERWVTKAQNQLHRWEIRVEAARMNTKTCATSWDRKRALARTAAEATTVMRKCYAVESEPREVIAEKHKSASPEVTGPTFDVSRKRVSRPAPLKRPDSGYFSLDSDSDPPSPA